MRSGRAEQGGPTPNDDMRFVDNEKALLRALMGLTALRRLGNVLHTTPIASAVGSRPPSEAVSVFVWE